jgi:hypothetical protein
LALAGVARWAEITRISTLRSRLGQGQYRQQHGPLQYFNSLLTVFPLSLPLLREEEEEEKGEEEGEEVEEDRGRVGSRSFAGLEPIS